MIAANRSSVPAGMMDVCMWDHGREVNGSGATGITLRVEVRGQGSKGRVLMDMMVLGAQML